MSQRAWTLGYPPSYEEAVRIEGNAKAPSGIIFQTRESAVVWRDENIDEKYLAEGDGPGSWEPYEVELPNGWDQDTSTDRRAVWTAFHDWHVLGTDMAPRHRRPPAKLDLRCGLCMGDDAEGELPHTALLVEARFVNPDTGELA